MAIPRKFTILHRTYKVSRVTKVDDDDSYGEYDYNTSTIKIKKGLSPDDEYQTFLHEITHAILTELSYDSLSQDERFVDVFSKALYQIIKTMK